MGGSSRQGSPRSSALRVVVAVASVLCVLLVLSGVLLGPSLGSRIFGPSAADLDRPPSERGPLAVGRSAPRSGPDAGTSFGAGEPEPGPSRYEELRCTFRGRALLDPGLPLDLFGRSRQWMELAPGASFECQGPPRPSAGEVEMSASFEELGLFNGVGTGEGTIHWSSGTELPESEAGDTTSLTHNEIELLFPEIVVWVMIIDGPYAGFRGKLALVDWTRVQDDEGRIVEIVFNPTEVIFSPT